MNIVINPGSGPVDGATLAHAVENMNALCRDAGVPETAYVRDVEADEEGGRFSFLVTVEGRATPVSVDMPGIPLDRVRYTGAEGQNIWHFPRLYVDGSSW